MFGFLQPPSLHLTQHLTSSSPQARRGPGQAMAGRLWRSYSRPPSISVILA